MEKKKNNLIPVVIILIVLVLGLGGVIVYDKVLNNEDNNVIDNNQENAQNNSVGGNDKLYTYLINSGEILNDNLIINGEKINISLIDDKFYINDNLIKLEGIMFAPSLVYVYENLIFLQKGTVDNSYYEVYDLNGKLLKILDDNVIKYAIFYNEITLSSNNKLLVSVKNVGNTGPYINDELMLCGCGQCPGTKTDKYIDEINNSNLFSTANYEIVYNKETKKIDVKLYSVTETLEEYLDDKISANGEWCVVNVND